MRPTIILALGFILASLAPTAQAICVDMEGYEDPDQDALDVGTTPNGIGVYVCSNGDCSAVAVKARCDAPLLQLP